MEWYALFVMTGKEECVRDCVKLEFEQEEVYPIFLQRRISEKRCGKRYDVLKSLFPGYVLIRSSMNCGLYYRLKMIPNIFRMLRYEGSYYTEINEEEVRDILGLTDQGGIIDYTQVICKDKRVEIVGGPLLFNRVKPYPGTLFSKNFGNILDHKYFRNDGVGDIFDCLQEYKYKFHKCVNVLMNIIESNIQAGDIDKSLKADYIWLKMSPYNILEKLVNCNSNYHELYESLVKQSKISEHLSLLEKKYAQIK